MFNRQELLWLQDKFPEHMKKQGFELKRGERGSDRKHIETAKFKKQTLEKEIDFLEKNLAVKKDEWTAYSDKVKSDLEVPAKRHMKSVEVPTVIGLILSAALVLMTPDNFSGYESYPLEFVGAVFFCVIFRVMPLDLASAVCI